MITSSLTVGELVNETMHCATKNVAPEKMTGFRKEAIPDDTVAAESLIFVSWIKVATVWCTSY